MSNVLALNCFVFGDDISNIFPVDIERTETVAALKDAIKEQKRPAFDDIPACTLLLWKVYISGDDSGSFKSSVKDTVKNQRPLFPLDKLSDIFTDATKDEQLHIVIKSPSLGLNKFESSVSDETDIVTTLIHRYHATIQKNLMLDPPSAWDKSIRYRSVVSEEADINTKMIHTYHATIQKILMWDPSNTRDKSIGYRSYQRTLPIYDGRYDPRYSTTTKGPPIQLFHPVFGHFLDDIANTDLVTPLDTLRATARFMDNASDINFHLSEALTIGTNMVLNLDHTSTDGAVVVTGKDETRETPAILIYEDSRESGGGGCDPSIQAGLSMARFWAQCDHKVIRDNTCCPTFLLVNSGPWFAVLGAIFTDKVVVQRLTDFIWVGDAINEQHCHRIAHVLYSLGRSLSKLRDYYLGVQIENIGKGQLHPRYLPSICAYRDPMGAIVEFVYIKPLEDHPACVTFLAKIDKAPSKYIVVKFVERYGEEAHRLLEKIGAAPQLFYYGKAGVSEGDPTYSHLRMVVMEYLDGVMAYEARESNQLPPTFADSVSRALKHLHENDFVFGDLRDANVMVTKNGDVKLIDFDWAGKVGESRYPLLLSANIQWPAGVHALAAIEKQHDEDMLKRLV